MKEFSRREVLNPKSWLKTIAELRSKEGWDFKPKPEDKAFEIVGETLALASILYTAWRGTQDPLIIYEAKAESSLADKPDFSELSQAIDGVTEIVSSASASASNLNGAWRSAYHKSRVVCKTELIRDCETTTDLQGRSQTNCQTVPQTECHTEWYWDEPYQLTREGINHDRLEGWFNFLDYLVDTTHQLRQESPQTFDLSAGENAIFYPKKVAASKTQMLLAFPAYALVGSAFIFYEEIARKIADMNLSEPFINDQRRIKRRTFLKLIGSGALSLWIRQLQLAFGEENKDLLTEIRKHTAQVLSQLDIPPQENFRRFFGVYPRDIRNVLMDIQDGTNKALTSNYSGFLDFKWPNIKNLFEQLRRDSEEGVKQFDSYFNFNPDTGNYTIPPALTKITSFLWATREITNFVNSKAMEVNSRHLVNAALMLLGLAGVATVGELVILPASDRFLDKFSKSS